MTKTEIISNEIVPRITTNTGIRISPIHEKSLEIHIEKMASERGISFSKYCELLVPPSKEFEQLINVATTNETYFFRERTQFEFLQSKVFPAFMGKKLTIWSGACASGEEPISLYSLAISCGVKPEIYASDIDSNELSYFNTGIYTKYSLNNDGKAFHNLLEETKTGKFIDEKFHVNQDIFKYIKIHQYNLASKSPPDFFDVADIIFLRNVFIYFENPLRKEILEKVARKLAPGGLLFLSVGEICCVGPDLIPNSLEKKNYGNVYYFEKKGGENSLLNSMLTLKSQREMSKNENLISSVTKKIEDARLNVEVQNKEEKKQKLDNNVHVETRTPEEIFIKINDYMSQKKYSEALTYLDGYMPNMTEKYFKDYYLALIYKDSKQIEDAIKHFSIAETINPNFWPSYFNHGLLLKDDGKENTAKRYFEKCLLCLKKSIEIKENDFSFLMESFSLEYFLTLCEKYVSIGEKK